MNFMNEAQKTMNTHFNEVETENGALAFRTTGKELLDINFAVSSLRAKTETQIEKRFAKVFYEDKLLAIKWLFYAGDVREGLGERRLFKIGFTWLADTQRELAKALIPLVPEYTRWDNLWVLLDTSLVDTVIALIKSQLTSDFQNMNAGKSISLLAKWLPSENASSAETKRNAKYIIRKLECEPKEYRKLLTSLRKHLSIVETQMSAKQWDTIDYSAVPSKANLMYKNAFLRNDETRRRDFLEALTKSEAKINAGVLFPHDIVHRYRSNRDDESLEALWRALPDLVKGDNSTLCVCDGSGSMSQSIENSTATAADVANALSIYFAEHATGDFANKFITFSMKPQIVDISNGANLREKLTILKQYREVANTNIEAVFDLILQTAINGKMSQADMPKNILILSDMEFDECAYTNEDGRSNRSYRSYGKPSPKLFETFAERYDKFGYKLPRLIFWNICSSTCAIPLTENTLGVALISGFSINAINMVLSGELDPFKCLLEQLNTVRYEPIATNIKELL